MIDSNDPQQTQAFDMQQSFAQDLDMNPAPNGVTMVGYAFAGGGDLPPGNAFQTYWQFSNAIYNPDNSFFYAPLTIVPFTVNEVDGMNFTMNSGLMNCVSAAGFNIGSSNSGFFGSSSGGATFLGNAWLRPGTWKALLASGSTLETNGVPPTGSIKVGSTLVSNMSPLGFSATPTAPRVSNIANAGTVNFIVPPGGGFVNISFSGTDVITSVPGFGDLLPSFQLNFTFLHA
jgi:hypothetical protein